MAKIGRSALNGGLQSRFPDNIIKFITALRARLQLTDISDSKFNLEDDTMTDIKFDNSGTDLTAENGGDALVELNNKVRPFLAGGKLDYGSIFKPSGTAIPIISGNFTGCQSIKLNQTGSTIYGSTARVTFNDVGTTNYQPIITVNSVDATQNHTLSRVYTSIVQGSKTNTEFEFLIFSEDGASSNVQVEIILITSY